MLPPLGIHILATLKNFKYSKYVIASAYLSAALFIGWFLIYTHSLQHHTCLGNYVIFKVYANAAWLFAFYYYVFIIAGLVLSARLASRTTDRKLKQALYGMSLGYAAFIIPTTTANILIPTTIYGIPSIMCGFAVILAIVIVTIVLPGAGTLRTKK